MARKNPVPGLGVRFLTATPTNPDAPTVAELTAGIDLRGTAGSEGLAAMAGWAVVAVKAVQLRQKSHRPALSMRRI